MDAIYHWLGDLNKIEGLSRELIGVISIVVAIVCGGFVGIERERRDKPAGLRTVILITVGSTIFTLVSLMLASSKPMADPARLASQIVPGIGFLGAGAIIYARGAVVGLTTGATIWSCAAVGVTIGSGYVAAGIVFTAVIFLTLTLMHRVEHAIEGRCAHEGFVVTFEPDRGKTWLQIQHTLDRYHVEDEHVQRPDRGEEQESVVVHVCTAHRNHRAVLKEIADLGGVVAIEALSEPCTVS